MSDKVLVATYGSLRVGMENVHVNEAAGAKFYGHGKTAQNHDLYRYNGAYFPSVSLQHSVSGTPVVVDVYETDEDGLKGPYDRLEGYPSFYNRTQIDVVLDSGETVKAWIYHIDREMPTRVEHGNWCKFKSEEV